LLSFRESALQLDSFTLLASGCALLAILGAVFVVLWLRDRRAVALLWWGPPLIVGGAGLTLYMRAGWDNDVIAIAIGNTTRIFALGAIWQGVRIFNGQKPALVRLFGACLVWLVLCLVPGLVEHLLARVSLTSIMAACLAGAGLFDLWRYRADGLRARWSVMAVFASFTVLMTVRAIVAPWAPFPVGAAPMDPVWFAAFMWVVVAHATFAGILFLVMLLERREAEQRSFAMSDPLTGLMNRRAFADFAERMGRRRAGLRSSMALLVLDLDHFKSVNDRYGHEVGDRMLELFARIAEQNVRPADQLFRMGGEEFCFALPETSVIEARDIAERVREAFSQVTVETSVGLAQSTVSIGIAASQHAVGVELLLAAADAAVYEAKARGRDCVVVAEPSILLRPVASRPDRLSA
jgi:diguanylate cyclase (GGDEF)-like protein